MNTKVQIPVFPGSRPLADPPSCQMVPTDSVLSSATGFLGHKADRNPRICFGRKRKKGRGKAGREGVGEGMRREAGLGREGMLLNAPIWWWPQELRGPAGGSAR